MRDKMIRIMLRRNLILDFNDCFEDYFDEYYMEENNIISRILEAISSLFRKER